MKNDTTKINEFLQCPYCQGDVTLASTNASCKSCKRIFYGTDGVISLLKDSNAIIDAELSGVETLDAKSDINYEDEAFQRALSALPDAPRVGKYQKGENYFWEVAIGKGSFVKAKEMIGDHQIILEVGADFCWAAHALATGNTVIALDINGKHLAAAQSLVSKTWFARVQGDMNELPVKDNSIDVVISNAAVHHTGNLGHTIHEFARVLKKDGRLIMLREPVCGDSGDDTAFGLEEKKLGINEHAPKLSAWSLALSRAGLSFECEIAKLNFFVSDTSVKHVLRSAKRQLLSLPFVGPVLAKNTITDYNFFATKEE